MAKALNPRKGLVSYGTPGCNFNQLGDRVAEPRGVSGEQLFCLKLKQGWPTASEERERMLVKIISGAKTGTERAALDAAKALGLPHGGWISKDRLSEDNLLQDLYNLVEVSSGILTVHGEMNVFDSDGTLVIGHGGLTDTGLFTKNIAIKHDKPWLQIDLNAIAAHNVPKQINLWLTENNIETLNVTGPKTSEDPNIYDKARKIVESVYFLNQAKSSMAGYSVARNWAYSPEQPIPNTVGDIITHVANDLSPKDRSLIANLEESDLFCLDLTLGMYLRRKLEFWAGSGVLWDECEALVPQPKEDIDIGDVANQIIVEVWKQLRGIHTASGLPSRQGGSLL